MSGNGHTLLGGKKFAVEIPLTSHTGKVRIKTRDTLYAFGIPHASRQKAFHHNNYVEWQVSYDTPVVGGEKTTLPGVCYEAGDGRRKSLFELSEIFCHFVLWGFIPRDEAGELADYLSALKSHDFLGNHPDCAIYGTTPEEKEINEVRFMRYELKYPKLIRRLSGDDNGIVAEIIIREKQRAVGVQPMLYLCFPVDLLDAPDLIGRCANVKETARFVVGKNSRDIIVELMKIFGMLSEAHNKDVVGILHSIIKYTAKPR